MSIKVLCQAISNYRQHRHLILDVLYIIGIQKYFLSRDVLYIIGIQKYFLSRDVQHASTTTKKNLWKDPKALVPTVIYHYLDNLDLNYK